MREKKTIQINERLYTIEALGSLEACNLLPTVAELAAPLGTALLAAVSGNVPGTTNELPAAIQGSKHYPTVARAAIAASTVQVPTSAEPGAAYGPPQKVSDLVSAPGSSFFSRRQLELFKLTLEFVKWNYSDFFADILPMIGQAIKGASSIQDSGPPPESTGTSNE